MSKQLKVAYLGPAATFSHEAAIKHFGPDTIYLPVPTIPDIFFVTARGEVDYGIVPVENSLGGAVTYTLDMFTRPEPELAALTILAEVNLPIVQNLLVAPDGPKSLDDIEIVYSHPQALAQCRDWLRKNLPKAELQEVASTSRAAELARDNLKAAGISNRLAAEPYGLRIFATDLQDADFNQTRFLVIGREPVIPAESDQRGQYTTAIMLSIKDRVGALHAVTSIFVKYGLNMNRIESRPSKQKAWDYVFFIDFIGHPSQPHVAAALEELNSVTDRVKVLGAWLREA
ncbi:MAG TPA: prephenate dehydratase [Chloroflexia bacterium]|nr:prephenate dehydratase [Chloroflexia bacterium]